jgi:hypothetical protein
MYLLVHTPYKSSTNANEKLINRKKNKLRDFESETIILKLDDYYD